MRKNRNRHLGKSKLEEVYIDLDTDNEQEIVGCYAKVPFIREENRIHLDCKGKKFIKELETAGKPYVLFVRPETEGAKLDNEAAIREFIEERVKKPELITSSRLTKSRGFVLETKDLGTAVGLLEYILLSFGGHNLEVSLNVEPLIQKYTIKGVDKRTDLEVIWNALKQQNRKPYKIIRLKRCKGELTELSDSILVYDIVKSVPKSLEIDSRVYNTAKFWEKLIQCSKCKAFGHHQKRCNGSYKCCKCSLDHLESECTSQYFKCTLCDLNHEATNKRCKKYTREVTITRIRNQEECTRFEAIQKLQEDSSTGESFNTNNGNNELVDKVYVENIVKDVKEKFDKKLDFLARILFEIKQHVSDKTNEKGIEESGNTRQIIEDFSNSLSELSAEIKSEIELGALQSRITSYACATELAGDIVDNGYKSLGTDCEEGIEYVLYKKEAQQKYLNVKKKLMEKEKNKSATITENRKDKQRNTSTDSISLIKLKLCGEGIDKKEDINIQNPVQRKEVNPRGSLANDLNRDGLSTKTVQGSSSSKFEI